MNNTNLNIKMIYSIINFQRKYKVNLESIKNLNKKVSFYNEIMISLSTNLTVCNNNRIFVNDTELYKKIVKKLEQIKNEIVKIPMPITFQNASKNEGLSQLSLNIIYIDELIRKMFDLLAPDNMNYALKFMVSNEWVYQIKPEILDELLFYIKMFVPINIEKFDSRPSNLLCDMTKDSDSSNDEKETKKDLAPQQDDPTDLTSLISNPFSLTDSTPMIFINGQKSDNSLTKSISDLLKDRKKGSGNKGKKIRMKKSKLNYQRCLKIVGDDNIKVIKNLNSNTVIEEKFGAKILIKLDNCIISFIGFFRDDLINISYNQPFFKEKYESLKSLMDYNILLVPGYFKDKYMKQLSLRDFIILDNEEISSEIKRKYNEYKNLQGKPLLVLVNEFVLASKYKKIDILTLLLMSNNENKKLAYVLFDILQTKDQSNMAEEIYMGLHHSIRDELDIAKIEFKEVEKQLKKLTESDIPYEKRIALMDVDEDIKGKAMEKLKSIKSSFQGDGKAQSYLDGLLKIPFGIFKECPVICFKNNFSKKLKELYPVADFNSEHQIDSFITDLEEKDSNNQFVKEWREYQIDTKEYIRDCRKSLDEAVYGHNEAKTQLERIIGQWINGEAKGAVLGLEGPPGTGKTSLAKHGLSKCLKDENGNPRPFAFLPIGGSTNGSTLVGHNYTYVGSTWGRIVDIMMTHKCMNPIIFIDEIDKVSHTEHGKEIISILTHLTDSTQNDEFEDKYFSGIKFDISKALIVFSFNDINLIDPILRDRITIIQTNSLSTKDKIKIVNDYMFPEILKDVGFAKGEIILEDQAIIDITETYTNEAGVRKLKEKLYELVRELNLNNIFDKNITYPYTVSNDFIKKIFENKPKLKVKKIADKPHVGLVNGLYASTSGIGGLTIIEVSKQFSPGMLDLTTTGSQGDVMVESIKCAKTIAWSLLTDEEKEPMISEEGKKKPFGLHVHTPEGAVKKDGPSAGAAITLAIYSVLTNKPVNNKVAMTGEINLTKQVTAIGGLDAKLNGAKKAGVTKALVPKENEEDLIRFRREGLLPDEDNFEIVMVENIYDVLKHALIGYEKVE
jgi:ATP-dependent Lon protease